MHLSRRTHACMNVIQARAAGSGHSRRGPGGHWRKKETADDEDNVPCRTGCGCRHACRQGSAGEAGRCYASVRACRLRRATCSGGRVGVPQRGYGLGRAVKGLGPLSRHCHVSWGNTRGGQQCKETDACGVFACVDACVYVCMRWREPRTSRCPGRRPWAYTYACGYTYTQAHACACVCMRVHACARAWAHARGHR